MNTQTQEALKMLDAMRLSYSDLIYNEAGFEKAEEFEDAISLVKKALATNEESSLVQPAQEPISFEMDELTEEWYGVLDDKTALIIYGGNRGYWSDKIYAHSTPDSTPDSTPAHQWQGLTDDEVDDFMFQSCDAENGYSITDLIRLVEQALKDKNT
jgi:hypothetical protein